MPPRENSSMAEDKGSMARKVEGGGGRVQGAT